MIACNSRVSAGVEPASPAWKAGTFAARPRAHSAEVDQSGIRADRCPESNSQGFRSTVFETVAITHWPALPFVAAEAGIEPATRRLTVAFPYQHRTHRIN